MCSIWSVRAYVSDAHTVTHSHTLHITTQYSEQPRKSSTKNVHTLYITICSAKCCSTAIVIIFWNWKATAKGRYYKMHKVFFIINFQVHSSLKIIGLRIVYRLTDMFIYNACVLCCTYELCIKHSITPTQQR